MAVPTWVSGQVLTADDVNNWFIPLAAPKTVDESVTSSTTLQNDDQLVISNIDINTTYLFQCFLLYQGGTGGSSDLQITWAVPTGTFLRYAGAFTGAGAGTSNVGSAFAASDVLNLRTQGSGVKCGATYQGTLSVGSTAGSLQLRWAQVTSSGTSTTVNKQSIIILTRMWDAAIVSS